jgi:hypothetical protein
MKPRRNDEKRHCSVPFEHSDVIIKVDQQILGQNDNTCSRSCHTNSIGSFNDAGVDEIAEFIDGNIDGTMPDTSIGISSPTLDIRIPA